MNVTIYCGASPGKKEIYKKATIKLGQWLLTNKHNLIYGGARVGLMGVIADTVIDNGGTAIGVMPNFLVDRELAHERLSEMHVVSTMSERKLKMFELGDCFIALPGGPGTLEEITEVVSWARVGQNDKPCIFYNVDGYYDRLRQFFDDMVEEGFLSRADREKILFSNVLEDLEKFLAQY